MRPMKVKIMLGSAILLLALLQQTVQVVGGVEELGQGIWSEVETPEINTMLPPPRMVLCGFQFRLKAYILWQYNCECGKRWYHKRVTYRCNNCPNTYSTMTNGFVGVFCSISNWKEQKSQSVVSGDTSSGNYNAALMCPEGYYANAFQSSFGYQSDVQLGFNGLALNCAKLDLSDTQKVTYSAFEGWKAWNYPQRGDFITGFKVKYVPGGRLTGFAVDYFPIPVISDVQITYRLPKDPTWTPQIISQREVSNGGNQMITENIGFSNKFEQSFSYTTSRKDIVGFTIGGKVNFKLPKFGVEINTSFYQSSEVAIQFNKQITKTWQSTQTMTVLIPGNSKVTISQVFYTNTMDIPFTAVLTFSNSITGEFIRNETVEGVWTGLFVQKEETKIEQKNNIASN